MNKGFMVPLAVAVLAILLILGTTMFMVSRQHLHSAHHYAAREEAYQIGSGAVELGVEAIGKFLEFLNNPDPSTLPKHENLPSEIQSFASSFFDGSGFLKEDAEVQLQSQLIDSLQDGTEMSVDLRLGLKKMGLIDSSSPSSGVFPDPREAIYLFTSTARVQGKGADLRVTTFKQWRMVNILLPVLGKFVLFNRDQGSLEVNEIPDTKLPSDLRSVPVAIISGQSLAAGEKLSPPDLKKHIDSQGWVFLGGAPWSLNLSHGWGSDQYQDAYTSRGLEYYAVGEGVRSGKDLKLKQLGSNISVGEFEWWRMISGFYMELTTAEEYEVLSRMGADLLSHSSTLNLYGTGQEPSPTLVLGDVRRRWALIQGLFNETNGIWAALPFLEQDEFENSSTWPGGATASSVSILRDNFDGDYEEYKLQMSQVIEEGYNEGLLWAIELGTPSLDERFHLECEELDPTVQEQVRVDLLKVDNLEHTLCKRFVGGQYSLRNDASNPIFENINLESFVNLSHLERRSSREFESFDSFLQEHLDPGSGILKLGGVMKIKGNLKLVTPLQIQSGKGGILLVDGDIEILAPINNPDHEPFSLVSLAGNLKLKISDPVHASLVALKGTVFLPSKFHVEGSIAADTISIDSLSGSSASVSQRILKYNLSLDPTRAQNWNGAYRIMQDPGWSYTVQ